MFSASAVRFVLNSCTFVKKGTDINTIDKETTIDINNKINQKKRKILGYLSSEELFLNELAKLNVTGNTIFYNN